MLDVRPECQAAARVKVGGFIDDKGLRSREREEVQKGADASTEYHRLSGQSLEVSKSVGWTTDRKARKGDPGFLLDAQRVPWAEVDKVLGVEHQYVRLRTRWVDRGRGEDAGAAAQRLGQLPLG